MTTRTWTSAAVLAAIGLAIILLVWPGSGPTPGQPDDDGRLEIVLRDYAFEVEEWTVPAGEPITLVFVNTDDADHPLTFGGEMVESDGRPAGYAVDLFDGLSPRVAPQTAVMEPVPPNGAFTVQVRGGDTVEVEVVFPEDRVGTWGVGCFSGHGCHFNAGLEATLTIE